MHRPVERIAGSRLDRRSLLVRGGAAVGAGLTAARFRPGSVDAGRVGRHRISPVLSPLAPDPAPPGVAEFAMDDFAAWKTANDARSAYEAVAWGSLHDKMATNFASGTHVHDVYTMSGWVPEFAQFLAPLDDMLPQDLVDDLPPSSFSTVTWDGNRLRRRLHAVATDALLQHGAPGRGRARRSADDLGRAEGLCPGADPRRPLRLGAELRRAGGDRRRRLLLDGLPAAGGRQAQR